MSNELNLFYSTWKCRFAAPQKTGKSQAPCKKFPTQFLPHTTDGGRKCIGWLESTEINIAEVITQVRSTRWKDKVVFFCLGIISYLN